MNYTEFVQELDRELETFGINTNGTPEAVLVSVKEIVREDYRNTKARAAAEESCDEKDAEIAGLEDDIAANEAEIEGLEKKLDAADARIEELTQELEACLKARGAA